jgi:hypothetical protein
VQQNSIAVTSVLKHKRPNRHEQFLKEMDQIVPWARLIRLIAPYYSNIGGVRQPMPLELEQMLRIYLLQQWFHFSDSSAENALFDMQSVRRFCLIDLAEGAVPNETMILNFRRLLERYRLDEILFNEIRRQVKSRRPLLAAVT